MTGLEVSFTLFVIRNVQEWAICRLPAEEKLQIERSQDTCQICHLFCVSPGESITLLLLGTFVYGEMILHYWKKVENEPGRNRPRSGKNDSFFSISSEESTTSRTSGTCQSGTLSAWILGKPHPPPILNLQNLLGVPQKRSYPGRNSRSALDLRM